MRKEFSYCAIGLACVRIKNLKEIFMHESNSKVLFVK